MVETSDGATSAEQEVVAFINLELPTLDDLALKGPQLIAEVREKKEEVKRQLDLSNCEPFLAAKARITQLEGLLAAEAALEQRYREIAPRAEAVLGSVRAHFAAIEERELQIKRFQQMERLELLSSSVQATLVLDAFDRTLVAFAELSAAAELHTEATAAASDPELAKFAQDKVEHWYALMKDQVTGDFEAALKAIHWPFLSTRTTTIDTKAVGSGDTEAENLDNFKKHFRRLLLLKLPDSMSEHAEMRAGPVFRDWRPLSPPVEVMLHPLRKRFLYNFTGSRKTNNLEKPEWCISQVMSWIKDHWQFLCIVVQPFVSSIEGVRLDARMEFVRGLVALVIKKLWQDLPEVLAKADGQEALFSHYIDEILSMDAELKDVLGYPSHLPSPVDLLLQEQWFQKWMQVERVLATSQFDEMLAPTGGVDSMLKPLSASFKRPLCVDGLLSLLQSMTGRARGLRSLTRRAQFLRLQLDLLDDFRLRLRQMSRQKVPGEPQWAALLNGLYAVRQTLADWSDDMFYVELWEDPSARFLCEDLNHSLVVEETSTVGDGSIRSLLSKPLSPMRSNSTLDDQNSVFDAISSLYGHLLSDMLGETIDFIAKDVKSRGKAYRLNKWLMVTTLKKDSNIGLSPSACDMFLLLRDWLHNVSESLEDALFQEVWQKLANRMNQFIYKQVILTNRFNAGGAAQLRFDVQKNLVPLFAVYTARPQHYFRESLEAIALLCLAHGSAILLRQVIHAALHSDSPAPQDPLAALQDVGVFRLDAEEAELVLSLRVEDDEK